MQRQSTIAWASTLRVIGTRVVNTLYPPTCMTCPTMVAHHGALCPECWRATPFIHGTCCDLCGVPLPHSGSDGTDATPFCDDCMTCARPWEQGRAVLLYGERARQILLGLKYYDRLDHVPVAAGWLARVCRPMLCEDMLVTPVPLAWSRLVKRRYNQSAELSRALAKRLELDHAPDLLRRSRATGTQDGRGRVGRFANVAGAFTVRSNRLAFLRDRHVLLVDDVMTSGATLAAASEALLAGGAASVRIAVLARVTRMH